MNQDSSNSDQSIPTSDPATSALDEEFARLFRSGGCLQRVVDQLSDALVCVSESGTIVFANPAVERIFGYRPEAVVGEPLERLVPSEMRDRRFEAVERYVRTGETDVDLDNIEHPGRHRDGHEVHLTVSLSDHTLDGIRLVTLLIRDSTPRKEREKQLRRQRAITESVIRAIPDVFYLFDENADLLKWNDRVGEVTGYSEAEIEEMNALEFVAPDDREQIATAIESVFEDGVMRTAEADYLTKDGERIPYEFTGATVTDDEGNVLGLTGIGRDISARKRHEQELKAQRERLETELTEVYRRITDAVIGLDADRRITYANERATALLDRTERSLVDDDIGTALPDHLAAEFRDAYERAVDSGAPTAVQVHEPTLESWFDVRVFPSGTGASLYLRDVSDRKQFERTLAALHESSQSLLSAETTTEVSERILAAANDVIDVPWACIYVADDGLFRPVPDTEPLEAAVGDLSSITTDGTPITQRSYEDHETIAIEDLEADDDVDEHETSVRSGIWTPIGDHGVLVTVSNDPAAFGRDERTLIDLLAANAEAALDRVEQEKRRRRRERQLEALAAASGALLNAQTPQDACDVAVEAAENGLDVPIASIALYDDNTLRPRAQTAIAERLVDEALFEPMDGTAWTAFVDDRVVVDEEPAATDDHRIDTYGVAAIPLGRHGVFVVGTPGNVTGEDRTMAQILTASTEPMLAEFLASSVEASLDRAVRERRLVERDEILSEQNERLERLNRISDVVRDIDQALAAAESRADIDHAVCSRLTAHGPFAFSWIGDVDHVTETVTPRQSSGVDDGYLDVVRSVVEAETDDPLPATRAIDTLEPQVEAELLADPPLSRWRKAALARGYRSCIALPLTHKDMRYGVLTVYADRPRAFGELERTALAELDRTLGNAINAIERTKALVSDDVVEVEFVVRSSSEPFLELTSEVDRPFELDSVISQAGGGYRVFFTVHGCRAEDVLTVTKRSHAIQRPRLVSDVEDSQLFECTVDESNLIGTLLAHGAVPQRFTAEDGEGNVVVTLPRDADIRSFVGMIRSTYEESEFVARRERRRGRPPRQRFEAEITDALTDRQQEVLLTAYECGFFETPRENSGSDVSDVIGVAQPTFTKHLRAAQRKLLGYLIDESILDGTGGHGPAEG